MRSGKGVLAGRETSRSIRAGSVRSGGSSHRLNRMKGVQNSGDQKTSKSFKAHRGAGGKKEVELGAKIQTRHNKCKKLGAGGSRDGTLSPGRLEGKPESLSRARCPEQGNAWGRLENSEHNRLQTNKERMGVRLGSAGKRGLFR